MAYHSSLGASFTGGGQRMGQTSPRCVPVLSLGMGRTSPRCVPALSHFKSLITSPLSQVWDRALPICSIRNNLSLLIFLHSTLILPGTPRWWLSSEALALALALVLTFGPSSVPFRPKSLVERKLHWDRPGTQLLYRLLARCTSPSSCTIYRGARSSVPLHEALSQFSVADDAPSPGR